MIEGFTWMMQGQKYDADVILFPLAGCDLILGMLWLSTLSSITWDCLNLTTESCKGGQKVKLMGCKQGRKMQHQL